MTRSMAAVDIAVQEEGEKVFVFGNAPTALFRLLEHDVRSAAWLACRSGSSARRSRKRRSERPAGHRRARPQRRQQRGGSDRERLLYHLREAQ
jgi:hypothetical protein